MSIIASRRRNELRRARSVRAFSYPRVRQTRLLYERFICIRIIRRDGHARYVCTGSEKPMVYPCVRVRLRARLNLRVFAGCLAVRISRSRLVPGCGETLVAEAICAALMWTLPRGVPF